MIWWILIGLLVVGIVVAAFLKAVPYGPNTFFERASDESVWREVYASPHQFSVAKRVLELFCEVFLQEKEVCFSLRPDDRIIDVYQVHYPEGTDLSDELEIETFSLDLEEEFSFEFEGSEFDGIEVTLRQVIDFVLTKTTEQADLLNSVELHSTS